MLQLSADKLQWIRNAVHDKQIFLVVDESHLSGMQYFNILVGSLETALVSYLHGYQPLPCAPMATTFAQAVNDAVRSLGINKNTFFLLLSDAVWWPQIQY